MKWKIIDTYNEVSNLVASSYLEKKPKLKSYILSFFLALFCVSAPLLVLINLLIFVDYLKFTIYGIVLCVDILYLLIRKFFLDDTTDVQKTYLLYLTEALSLLVLLTIAYFISWIWW